MNNADIDAWHEYDTVMEGIELGYLCAATGRECEFEHHEEIYGEDADGNRGIWVTYRRCRQCGEEA